MNTIEFPQTNEHELLRIRNEIQRRLIERALPSGDNTNESKIDWIHMNSTKFGEFFDAQMIENPNLVDEFNLNPDLVVKMFEVMLIGSSVEGREDLERAA